MLTILGKRESTPAFCDGITRRNFLKIGSLGMGLSLPQLLAAEARAGIRGSKQIDHSDLSRWGPSASGHVRPETGGAE